VQGNILDDEELIAALSDSKAAANTIAAKVAEAAATERAIDEARERYRPVAVREPHTSLSLMVLNPDMPTAVTSSDRLW
jgi:hypothetical protein